MKRGTKRQLYDASLDHSLSFPPLSVQLYFESAPGVANRFDIEVRSGDKNPRVVASCAAMSPGNQKVSKGESMSKSTTRRLELFYDIDDNNFKELVKFSLKRDALVTLPSLRRFKRVLYPIWHVCVHI